MISDSAGPALRIEYVERQRARSTTSARCPTRTPSSSICAHDNVMRGNDVSGNKGGISLEELERQHDRGQRRERLRLDRHRPRVAVLQQPRCSTTSRNNNGGGGIYIGDETPSGQGTLVQGNTTNSNKGMGIQATKPAHIFKDNIAFDNDSWGIYAGDPSSGRANIDAGGNIAQGNQGPLGIDLKPQQCYNITCVNGPGGGDAIAPNTSILEGPIQPESSESIAVFRFSGADNASPVTFECRFNSALESRLAGVHEPEDLQRSGQRHVHLRGPRVRRLRQCRSRRRRATPGRSCSATSRRRSTRRRTG